MNLVLGKIYVSSIEGMEVIVEPHHPTCVVLYNANGLNSICGGSLTKTISTSNSKLNSPLVEF